MRFKYKNNDAYIELNTKIILEIPLRVTLYTKNIESPKDMTYIPKIKPICHAKE